MLTALSRPEAAGPAPDRAAAELLLASAPAQDGERRVELAVPEIHCAGCIARIERALKSLPDVTEARVNLTTKRVRVRWRRAASPPPVVETLKSLGFTAHVHEQAPEARDARRDELVRALAVAGFASMNIMLLSVSVWAGAGEATRDLFHWISALIALPTLAYSGRVFFRSAWRALRRGQTNMDVPISIGVLTAFGLSLYETATHGPHAYFDAAVMLLFFLLVGRTLDHVVRDRARTAASGLARLAARSATVVQPDGTLVYRPTEQVEPGMTLLVAAGERVPVNARVLSGESEIDVSMLTGESAPEPARPGDRLLAGALNLSGPLRVTATATAQDSFLADMTRMMEAAEEGRSRYRRIADRAARAYAPVVHLTALASLLLWWGLGGDFHRAVTVGVAVLIITCPCALGLAVPMTHVAAARRLFAAGVLAKDGAALERLAEVDSVIFDKTGTLTTDEPALVAVEAEPDAAALASALASHSRHPYARAIATAVTPAPVSFEDVREAPGDGVQGAYGGSVYRLGRAAWAVDGARDDAAVALSRDGAPIGRFVLASALRPDAEAAIGELRRLGLPVEIVSGDHEAPVRALAAAWALPYRARATPAEKTALVAALVANGGRPLMVGDGVNDAPALTAAHASMAPAEAADIGRSAADFVFLRPSLAAAPFAIRVARRAARIVRQNFALAIAYNALAVPLAVAGLVTPLIAAIAMSTSSLLVTANALRAGGAPRQASP